MSSAEISADNLTVFRESPAVYDGSRLRGSRPIVYLAYLDDSDTKSKANHWQVVCGVLFRDDSILALELVSATIVEQLMPAESLEKFTEFHACELFGGYGVFEGIDQAKRFAAVEDLLRQVSALDAKVFYGAINLEHLRKQPYASANAMDIAFRKCAQGIGKWLEEKTMESLKSDRGTDDYTALFISDEFDKETRSILQKSFRSMRPRFRFSGSEVSQLPWAHDDIYFGDSRYSIGIQIADLCSYFIARHLAEDVAIDGYYRMIEPQLLSEAHEP